MALPAKPPADTAPITSRRGHFWVGAEPDPSTGVARGPMFVYWEAPVEVTKPYPIVLVHGGGGQGLDYLGTPDGRPGWSTLLVEQGWVVYVVDRPGHGRSPYVPEALGPMGPPLPIEVLTGHLRSPDRWSWCDAIRPSPHAMAGRSQRSRTTRRCCSSSPAAVPSPPTPPTARHSSRSGSSQLARQDRSGIRGQQLPRWSGRDSSWPMLGPTSWSHSCRSSRSGRPFATMFGPDTLQWGVAAVPMTFDPPASSPERVEPRSRTSRRLPGAPPLVLQSRAGPQAGEPRPGPHRCCVGRGVGLPVHRRSAGRVPAAGRVRRRAHRSRRARGARQQSRLDVRTQQRRSACGRHRLDVEAQLD